MAAGSRVRGDSPVVDRDDHDGGWRRAPAGDEQADIGELGLDTIEHAALAGKMGPAEHAGPEPGGGMRQGHDDQAMREDIAAGGVTAQAPSRRRRPFKRPAPHGERTAGRHVDPLAGAELDRLGAVAPGHADLPLLHEHRRRRSRDIHRVDGAAHRGDGMRRRDLKTAAPRCSSTRTPLPLSSTAWTAPALRRHDLEGRGRSRLDDHPAPAAKMVRGGSVRGVDVQPAGCCAMASVPASASIPTHRPANRELMLRMGCPSDAGFTAISTWARRRTPSILWIITRLRPRDEVRPASIAGAGG